MAYSNLLQMVGLRGDDLPPVDFTLWRLDTTIDDDGIAVDHQFNTETVTVTPSAIAQVPVSMTNGPSFQGMGPAEMIALTVKDSMAAGFMFRTGVMSALPATAPGDPAGFLDIILADVSVTPLAAVTASLPPVPFPVSGVPGASVTSITASFGAGFMTILLRPARPQFPWLSHIPPMLTWYRRRRCAI